MNTKYFKFVGLGALAMLAACTDNDYTELDKGYTELALTASTDEVVLQESNHSSEAIALDWTTGTNYGTGNRISYTLDIARSGSDFANPVTIKSGVQQDIRGPRQSRTSIACSLIRWVSAQARQPLLMLA